MKRFPILQSGFIDFNEQDLNKPQVRKVSVFEQSLAKDHLEKSNPYFFSEGVTDIFTSFNKNPEWIRDFDNREHVLKTALKSFKANTITEWMIHQANSTTIGNLHRNFLLETLAYVYDNIPRKMGYYQWYRLLHAEEVTEHYGVKIAEYFGKRNGIGAASIPVSIEDFIHYWIRQPDGFSDLVFGLQAIFGARNNVIGVA